MNIETPKDWRIGQTIFNFLWWLQLEKGYPQEIGAETGRMADPFNISNTLLKKLYKEFLEEHK